MISIISYGLKIHHAKVAQMVNATGREPVQVEVRALPFAPPKGEKWNYIN